MYVHLYTLPQLYVLVYTWATLVELDVCVT